MVKLWSRDTNELIFWTGYANYVLEYTPSIVEQIAFLNFVIASAPPDDASRYKWKAGQFEQEVTKLIEKFKNSWSIAHVLYRAMMSDEVRSRIDNAFLLQTALITIFSKEDVQSRVFDFHGNQPIRTQMNRREPRRTLGQSQVERVGRIGPAFIQTGNAQRT